MTTYTAPPNVTNLTLGQGDFLYVYPGGVATNTVIGPDGTEYVSEGGTTNGTMLGGVEPSGLGAAHLFLDGAANNTSVSGGTEVVDPSGVDNNGTINRFGVQDVTGTTNNTNVEEGTQNVYAGVTNNTFVAGEQIVYGGVTNGTTVVLGFQAVYGGTTNNTVVNGAQENVYSGTANNTTINGGVEDIVQGSAQALAHNVTFGNGGPPFGPSILELGTPSQLTGTITNWQIGDVIDILSPGVRNARMKGDELTVKYGHGQKATYTLVGLQPGTDLVLQSDGSGGTNLILEPGGNGGEHDCEGSRHSGYQIATEQSYSNAAASGAQTDLRYLTPLLGDARANSVTVAGLMNDQIGAGQTTNAIGRDFWAYDQIHAGLFDSPSAGQIDHMLANQNSIENLAALLAPPHA
jgi:autotransporter passenger strand-loop-strand repeat protein